MRKLSGLELSCLALTLVILAGIATAMLLQQRSPPPDSHTILASNLSENAVSPQDSAAEESGVDDPSENEEAPLPDEDSKNFSERARLMPNPATNLNDKSNSLLTAVPSQGHHPAIPPPVFGTNEVMLALQQIATMPWSPASEKLLQDTLSKWAATDPTAALQYAMQIESRRVRSNLIGTILSNWAKTDVTSAYNWVMSNRESDPGTFQMGLRPVFTALAALGVSDAMKMAFTIPSSNDRLSALRIVVEQAARQGVDPASFTSYMDSLQTPGDRKNYASMLAQNWAVYAPQEAAQWALSLTDPSLRQATLSSTLGTWANDNPQAAADWVLSLPPGDMQSRQIAQITQTWARYDPVQAADWLLAQHPPSPNLDPAIQGLVSTVARSNPEGAVMWAATISDPRVRNHTIVHTSRAWMKSDPKKASAYIISAPLLTPSQRQRLLQGR